jgi:2-oxoglutarate ferredoxin oxidoreductase subunit beta
VARSFSGDKKQLVPLIRAAIAHQGPAFIDIVSPCVQFNNHPGSTKSYDFVRAHNEAVNRVDFVPSHELITADYDPGTTTTVRQHDGSLLRLAKLDTDYDPTDRTSALTCLAQSHQANKVLTGLLFIDEKVEDLHSHLGTTVVPLNRLDEKTLCPGSKALAGINDEYR